MAAATLSHRYISDRFLPDKAIDLMDEAASRLRMQVDSKPEELDALDREILQKQIEAEALKKETDLASQDRLEKLVQELSGLEERSAEMTARWKAERDKLKGAADIKEKLDQARGELDNAKRQGNLARAGELAYGIIPGLERDLEAAEAKGGQAMVEEAVTPEQIAAGRRALDRHPGRQDARGRAREAHPHGGGARAPRHRPARGGRGGVERGQAGAGGARTTRTGRWGRSSSSGRRASARPS